MPIIVNQNGTISESIDPLSLRSDEVQDFISRKPNFFIRWGIVLFFLILVIVGIVCWFIEYPDLVSTRGRLTSINAPKEVITRTEGKLQAIKITNGEKVMPGSVLAYMESIANPSAVLQLKRNLDSILWIVSQNKTDQIINYFPNYSNQQYLNEFGELQQSFQTFMQSFVNFKDYISNGFYLRKRLMLQTDMNNIIKLHAILEEQLQLLNKDLALSKQTFDANESLAKDKVISALDYRNEQSKLIAKQMSLPQLKSAIVSNESQQNEKKKEIAELENQIIVQKNIFIQSLQSLLSQIQQWELKYVLKSPISGIVEMSGFFQPNQFVKNGQVLFSIQPDSNQYFTEILIPQYNFGKVSVGQKVLLKFQAFPHEQFGSVAGKVEYISSTPTDSGYLAKVILPKGLVTSYGKKLHYQYGLLAQADIITENMRLLERFYYNIRKQISR
ncbi:MAG: HlyD family efflux transporter periplasmic adaptor subunit [Chitinophagaceae bacterium]|nr:HlyD family efflux transporter periplasmic adaptor subunit [Chitinophagaceae bacterium]